MKIRLQILFSVFVVVVAMIVALHCCPVTSRIESADCWDRADGIGSPMTEGPAKWAFFQKARD